MANPNPKTDHLHKFQKGVSGNPDGAPRKLLSWVNIRLKEEGFDPVKPDQLIDAYNTLLNLTEGKIKEIIADSEYPMFLRVIGKAMLSGKGVEMIEKILDRAHGKAKQSIEHSGTIEAPINLILDERFKNDTPLST